MSKIGIVTNGVRNNEFGGSHIYLTQLCRRLIEIGWDVTLFSYDSAFNVFPEQEHFVSLGKDFSTPRQLTMINRNLSRLEKYLSQLDVIHTDWWLAAPVLRRLTRKHNIRYVFDSRGSLFNINRAQNVYKWLILKLWHPDHIIFVDHISYSAYQDKFGHDKSSLIPVPIDTELFSVQRSTNQQRPFHLLFASWLRQEKGLSDFLAALDKVWQNHPKVKVLIAGEGYLREQVETLAAQDERVTYLGKVPNSKMVDVYAQADLLVYPSYFEGFPRAILEAYACGLPTVATEVGGLSLLREKNIGLVVQPGSVDDLAEAICSMIEQSAIYQQFATAGQIFVHEKHSWPIVLQNIVRLY